MSNHSLAENKKGLFDNEILEKWQAGLKLTGAEVKSAKAGRAELKGSYITLKMNPKTKRPEAWLIGAKIAKYPKAGYSQADYQPDRSRKLLLNSKELAGLVGKTKQKGLTIIPVLMYTSKRLIKLEIALVKGKKKFDKREALKRKDFERRKARLLKR
jgi:SsrA-binding protein